jgi:hypothetical protein
MASFCNDWQDANYAIATHSHLRQTAPATWSFAMGQIIRLPVAPAGYPDTVTALEPAENVLLIAIRSWVAACRSADDPMPCLQQELARAGAPDAAFSVDALMTIVRRTVQRPIAIHCPRCPRLAVDETHLLHAASVAQAGNSRRVDRILRTALLLGNGAAFALGPLEGLGTIFARTGLMFPQRGPRADDRNATSAVQAWTPSMSSTVIH